MKSICHRRIKVFGVFDRASTTHFRVYRRWRRKSATLRRGIERLIDSYAEGVLEKAEFTPRIAGLKQRLSLLEERRQAAEDAAGLERDLSLIISRTEDFAAKVVKGTRQSR